MFRYLLLACLAGVAAASNNTTTTTTTTVIVHTNTTTTVIVHTNTTSTTTTTGPTTTTTTASGGNNPNGTTTTTKPSSGTKAPVVPLKQASNVTFVASDPVEQVAVSATMSVDIGGTITNVVIANTASSVATGMALLIKVKSAAQVTAQQKSDIMSAPYCAGSAMNDNICILCESPTMTGGHSCSAFDVDDCVCTTGVASPRRRTSETRGRSLASVDVTGKGTLKVKLTTNFFATTDLTKMKADLGKKIVKADMQEAVTAASTFLTTGTMPAGTFATVTVAKGATTPGGKPATYVKPTSFTAPNVTVTSDATVTASTVGGTTSGATTAMLSGLAFVGALFLYGI